MTREEAIELLMYHSGDHRDIHNPKWSTGFLGSLRPYKGHFIQQNYKEVMACIGALADDLGQGETVGRQAVACLWGICHRARAWGIEPRGMLPSNNLISDEDIDQLDRWIYAISYATMMLLDGAGWKKLCLNTGW